MPIPQERNVRPYGCREQPLCRSVKSARSEFDLQIVGVADLSDPRANTVRPYELRFAVGLRKIRLCAGG